MTVAGKINSGTEPAFAQSEPAKTRDPTKDALNNTKLGARRGRPTKLNKKLLDDVANMIRECTPEDVACARVGITKQCFNAWRRRGKAALELHADGKDIPEDELSFADFETVITQALADTTAILVRLNLGHAKRNPITAMRMLERFDASFRQSFSTNVNASVKSESEHHVSGTVDHRHLHAHTGTLTVQGADALRRDALLGGKSIEQARIEHAEAKRRLNGGVNGGVVEALPENGDG